MSMRAARPYHLDLFKIRQPIGAWVSILHRLSGAVLALAVPVLLYAFMLSLRSEPDFDRLIAFLQGGSAILSCWGRSGRRCIISWPACGIWA